MREVSQTNGYVFPKKLKLTSRVKHLVRVGVDSLPDPSIVGSAPITRPLELGR